MHARFPLVVRSRVSRVVAGTLGLVASLSLATLAGGQTPAGSAPSTDVVQVEDSVQGEQAIERLGADLPVAAGHHAMTAGELVDLLRRDESLWLARDGGLFHACFTGHQHEADESEATMMNLSACAGPPEVPLEDTFTLASVPSATKTVYLDFDGHHSVDNAWGHDIVFPPYNTEGSSATFTDAELIEIQATWWRVVEDFAPFNVNVTTADPGIDALTNAGGDDETYGIRCVMTQATDGFGSGIGGIAYLNSFDDAIDNPVFGFNKGINNGSMTASHEVGHSLGLLHDGLHGSTYHPGAGSGETSWGPIMGAPFGMNVIQWSNGDYEGSTSLQDDLQVMTSPSNGFGFRSPDHAYDFAAAETLEPNVSIDGLITNRSDLDAFRVATAGGTVTVEVHPVDPGPNLDARIKLYDHAGTTLGAIESLNDVDLVADIDLPAGTFFIRVDGGGNGDVYSDYGSVGRYCLSADFAPGTPCPADLDESGDVSVSDLLLVLGAWGGPDGDVDGDGTTDVADLLALLAAWGACGLGS